MFGSSKILAQIADIDGKMTELLKLRAEVRRLNQVVDRLQRKRPSTGRASPKHAVVRRAGGSVDVEATTQAIGKSVQFILSNRPWPHKSAEWAVMNAVIRQGRAKSDVRTVEEVLGEYGPEQLELPFK